VCPQSGIESVVARRAGAPDGPKGRLAWEKPVKYAGLR